MVSPGAAAISWTSWPRAYWLHGDREKAEALAREAAVCKHAVDDRNGLTMVLETLASMAAERGAHERAGILLGFAQRVRDSSSLTLMELYRQQHERSVSITPKGSARNCLTRGMPGAAR